MPINIAGFSKGCTIRNTKGVLVPLYNYIFDPYIELNSEDELTYEKLINKLEEEEKKEKEKEKNDEERQLVITDFLNHIAKPTGGNYKFTFTDRLSIINHVFTPIKLINTIEYVQRESASSTHAPSGPTVYVDPSVTALRNLQINSVPASKYIKYKSKYLQLKKLLQQI